MEWSNVFMWLRNECTPAPGYVGGRSETNPESSQTHVPLDVGVGLGTPLPSQDPRLRFGR